MGIAISHRFCKTNVIKFNRTERKTTMSEYQSISVKDAINNKEISPLAYECYQKLSNEAIFKKERYNK